MEQRKPERDALVSALITEAVSVGAMLAMLWALQHTTEIQHWWWRARNWREARADREARLLREVRRDISRMEHPEA